MQDNEKIRPFDIIVGLQNISYLEKLLLFKINNLDNDKDGCYARDEWFADLFKVHPKSINRCIGNLEKNGLIIKQHPDGKRKIKVVLPTGRNINTNQPTGYQPSNRTVTANQLTGYQPSNRTVDYNTKDITKEKTKENRESALAFDFLKLNYPKRMNPWEKINRPQIKDYEKFVLDYSDLVEVKQLPYDVDGLFNFLCRYAKGWIDKQPKYDRLQSMD